MGASSSNHNSQPTRRRKSVNAAAKVRRPSSKPTSSRAESSSKPIRQAKSKGKVAKSRTSKPIGADASSRRHTSASLQPKPNGKPRNQSGSLNRATTRRPSKPIRSGNAKHSSIPLHMKQTSKNGPLQIDANVLQPTTPAKSRSRRHQGIHQQRQRPKVGFFGAIGHGIAALARRSKVLVVALILVILVGVGVAVDAGLNGSRIYEGVAIGGIDVGGKTRDEAAQLVRDRYGDQFAQSTSYIFANDQARTKVDVSGSEDDDSDTAYTDEDSLKSLTVDEAQQEDLLWVETPESLQASLPIDDLVSEAYQVGRDDGGLMARIGAASQGHEIPLRVDFNEDSLELLAQDIDETIGDPRVDYNVEVVDDQTSIIEGHDGQMINRDYLRQSLSDAFLSDDQSVQEFVAYTEFSPSLTTRDQAESAAQAIDSILDDSVSLDYDGVSIKVDGETLGSWVSTSITPDDDGAYKLVPYIDPVKAVPTLSTMILQKGARESFQLNFQSDGDDISALTDGNVVVPQLGMAVDTINEALFVDHGTEGEATPVDDSPTAEDESSSSAPATYGNAGSAAASASITIGSDTAPAVVNFDDALQSGLVEEISSFTTQYLNNPDKQNRVNNIHLAADLINNSIVPANGGEWSFNETAGECNAERGFLGAGTILANEVQDAVGGGICQVATTVFNAVYQAGFPITERHNHSLYMTAYPAGRDAAVSYPELDLRWENDTSSDVLLRMSYTDTSITATLYGVNPGYDVTTKSTDLTKGETYGTKYETDSTLASGYSYVKAYGQDGSKITVYRTVKDPQGHVIREDAFGSVYAPTDQVIVQGTG